MPPVVPVLQRKIDSMFEAAFERAAVQTAVLAETNKLTAIVDDRPQDVKEFERAAQHASFAPAYWLLAEKVYGMKLNRTAPESAHLKPVWHGVFKLVKPEFEAIETYAKGLPWGTVLMFTNSKGLVRDAAGSSFKLTYLTSYVQAASEAEIRTYLTGLFASRPAATVKLFRLPSAGGVIGSEAEEEV